MQDVSAGKECNILGPAHPRLSAHPKNLKEWDSVLNWVLEDREKEALRSKHLVKYRLPTPRLC